MTMLVVGVYSLLLNVNLKIRLKVIMPLLCAN